MSNAVTTKISVEALRLARLIAASTGEKQYEVFDRLLTDEAKILGLAKAKNQMAKWREDNTEGFTAAELAILNSVQNRLEAEHPDLDGRNIADVINNAWVEGSDEDALCLASIKHFGQAA